MIHKKNIHVIGSASGIAANNQGCGMGPLILQTSPYLQQLNLTLEWEPLLYAHQTGFGMDALPAVSHLCTQIAEYTDEFTSQRQPFIVMGGDHSCAIGTWSGAASALAPKGPLGLIWIDAHMDSHTPETTHSNNIHGMPLANLLGHGPMGLTQILGPATKLLPEHVCLIGVRSFEAEEAALLERLKVRVFFMDEIKQKGVAAVMQEALTIISGTAGYGISIDLDAVDPQDAPGVGAPAPDGIAGNALCQALTIFKQDPRLIGIEIAEFNPNLDKDHKTEQLAADIVRAIFE